MMARYMDKQSLERKKLKAFKKKYFETAISLDDLLSRKKIYPFQSRYTWEWRFKDWIKKNRSLFGRLREKTIISKVRTEIIDVYNEVMIDDVIYNHTIIEMPYGNIFLFISQEKNTNKDRKLNLETDMYDVNMQAYYKKVLYRDAKYKFKIIKLLGKFREKLDKAITDGHRYPRWEEVVKFIEATTNV